MDVFIKYLKHLKLPIIAYTLLSFTQLKAQGIKGRVYDASSKETLIGAVIRLQGANVTQSTSANLEGKYSFKNLQHGDYTLTCTYTGYIKTVKQVSIANGTEEVNFVLTSSQSALNEVVVRGSLNKETDAAARFIEKNTNQVVNILSAKTIQLLPDITVANVIQRVSGVVIDRSSSGEGRYPVIRGMDKRYNTTLVNGIKIPSPDNNNRYVPLDLFPAELLQSLEVSKSLIPSMESDAIGGTINLVMKDAPNQLSIQANIAGGYSTIFANQPFEAFNHNVINKKSPAEINGSDYITTPKDFPRANLNYSQNSHPVNSTYGLTIGDRFGKNKQFGAVVSASYQDIYRGTNSTYLFPNPQPAIKNVPVFSDIYLRKYSFEDRRLGVYGKLDYRIKPGQKISLFATYINTNQFQARNTVDSILAIQRTGPGNGNVNFQQRTTWTIQDIFNITLQGEHALGGRFKFDWSGVYSRAKQQVPDQAIFSTLESITTDGRTGTTTTTPTVLDGQMTREWFHNTDQDAALYANLTYHPNVFGRKAEFKAGGLVRHKHRDNYYNPYALTSLQTSGNQPQVFTNIFDSHYGFSGVYTGGSGEINANTYSISEDIDAGYLQGKILLSPKLEALGGLRVEYTYDSYQTVQPAVSDGRSGTIHYNDLLPSLQLKYALTDQQNLRLAYYKAISRPGYFEIVPTRTVGEFYSTVGNYDLKRSRADNLDLRYEFFPGAADQILLGAFYKQIQDPIEISVQPPSTSNFNTLTLIPLNFGVATNLGLEATITKYVGSFGVSANYTYTHSRITTNKILLERDAAGQIVTSTVSEKRPLQGQANNIVNVSFLYKNFKNGLDVQLAYVYTGQRIVQLSPYYGLDYYQTPFNQLDFSIEKKFLRKFSIYSKVNNLTNSPLKVKIQQQNTFLTGNNRLPIQENSNFITVQKDYYKPSFLLGLRYHL